MAPSAVPNTITNVGLTANEKIARSSNQLQSGKRLVQEGDISGARLAFDEALRILMAHPADAVDRARVHRQIEELVDLIHRYDVDSLGAGDPGTRLAFDKSPLDDLREMTFPLDPRLRPKVQTQARSTQSQLPLEINDTVLSFINYFTTTKSGRNTLINGWRRSGRYKGMIERVLAEENVPQELIFLAQAESGFLPRARSYKAACGMWQFVQWRGREYGLEQNAGLDLRLDPERATRAAARHLRDLYTQFGDWYLAMAAYNCGPGCVSRAVERTGYANYWDLHRRNAIPRETSNYVPIILAMTIVTKNAESYGLKLDDPEPALEYDSVHLSHPTHIELVAGAADYPLSGIQDLNPALLKSVAPAGYTMHVPKGFAEPVLAGLDSVRPDQRAAWRLHRVQPGESVAQIAQLYRIAPKTIVEANTGTVEDIEEGDMLMIPASREKGRSPLKVTAKKKSRVVLVRQTKRARAPQKSTAQRASR